MRWEKFFGTVVYKKLKEYCEIRHMSMASVIRNAVIQYIDKDM